MLRHLAALIVFFCLLMSQAGAQEPPQKPYLGSKDTYQIFVLGDSLAAGLWSGLTRVSEGDARLSVNGRYKEDSGLARPEYYDWNSALPKILKSNAIDIAVVMIGTNDAQDIRDGHLRHAFGVPDWNTLYAAQVSRLIQTLKDAGAAVYWVELPPMASPRYEAEIKAISAIHAERTKAAGVKHVGTREAFGASGGGYTDKGFDDAGEFVRLRSRDGVHFLKQGNNRLASLVLEAIRADIQAADGAKTAASAPPESAKANGPAFGQDATEGENAVVYLEAPPAQLNDPQSSKTDFAGSDVMAANPGLAELARSAVAGSNAARLFTFGEIPAPKSGRFDDFSVPQ